MKKIQILISRLAIGLSTLLIGLGMTPIAHAQFPGTNGRILWTTPNSGQYTIFPNGTNINATGLPTIIGTSITWQAIYTPSGQYIVHMNVASPGAASNVYVTNAAHTITPVAITSFTTCNVGNIASNSTGTKIAFTCTAAGPVTEVYVIDLNISGSSISGSNQIQLTNQIDSTSSFEPVWAPDNSVIYIRNGNKILSISPNIANQTTGSPTVSTIYDVKQSFRLNDVSPAGTTLLYSLGASNQLFTVSVGGTGNTQISSDASASYHGGYYSPDGTRIVAQKDLSNLSDQQLVLMTSTGASESVLYSLNNGGTVGVQSDRPFWSTDQNTYSRSNNGGNTTGVPNTTASGSNNGGNTPGVPNTTAVKAEKNSPMPWLLGGLLALMLAGLGGFWITKELKGKK
jgi:hypothetical protein